MAKKKAAAKAPTKTELCANISDKTGLSKKDVSAVLDALGEELNTAVKTAGQFTLHGLLNGSEIQNPYFYGFSLRVHKKI